MRERLSMAAGIEDSCRDVGPGLADGHDKASIIANERKALVGNRH